MSLEKSLTAFAGLMIILSVALTYFIHPNFIWFTLFVGVNLFQQSFTGFCPASIFMKKVCNIKTERELTLEEQNK
ncbi:DUF2892 domain-containing protein [Saccharobesus litoralis]|uniref:DUF2892 domain-containing protein n=1 Tax=Saccharobesus litoralis TaxID=2172099 RepID=A0A2S0VXV6_9ALTE|nr:DUF2892 domain-containing protein [Saccharobesus litoralis]AWB69057.1 DUF2892 domain-containing protein [Saccharobesus litoralis]